MARRLNTRNDEETRSRIQVSQLINRLQNHVDGNVEMSASQLRAAEILLKKSLPDLQAIQHDIESGDITVVLGRDRDKPTGD